MVQIHLTLDIPEREMIEIKKRFKTLSELETYCKKTLIFRIREENEGIFVAH